MDPTLPCVCSVIDYRWRYCQIWLERRFLWNENLQQKQIWTATSTNLKENTGKSSQFLWSDHPVSRKAWTLPWILRRFKNTPWKLAVVVNTGGHSIHILKEMSTSDGGNLSPLWLVILKAVWNSVGDTLKLRYSWPWAVVSYTLLAAVPWNGLEHSRRKAGYVFILTDFKTCCFDVSFQTSICVNILKLRLRKVEFFKYINLINILFIGFVKLSNGFLP